MTNKRTLKDSPLSETNSGLLGNYLQCLGRAVKYAIFRFAVKIFARGNLACLRNEQRARAHGIVHAAVAHIKCTLLDETEGERLMELLGRRMRKIGNMEKLTDLGIAPDPYRRLA